LSLPVKYPIWVVLRHEKSRWKGECVDESGAGGKLRFTRQRRKVLNAVAEMVNGGTRFKPRRRAARAVRH
jgi:hypothetical protein